MMKCSKCGIEGIHACLGEPNKCLVCGGSCNNTACIKTAITCDEFKKQFLGEFKPEPNSKIFVFAGNHHEYEMFIREHKLSRNDFVYIGEPKKLAGIWKPKYIRLENYLLNDELGEILEMLIKRDATEIKL